MLSFGARFRSTSLILSQRTYWPAAGVGVAAGVAAVVPCFRKGAGFTGSARLSVQAARPAWARQPGLVTESP